MKFQKTKIIFKIIFSFFFLLLLIEILIRIIIFFPTNIKIFQYGLNQNIYFNTLDLSRFEFVIYDFGTNNNNDKKFVDNNFWIFGGSTTKGDICEEKKSSSWPIQINNLNRNFKFKNFSSTGSNTDYQLTILLNEIAKNKPNVILWASKFNTLVVTTFDNYKNQKILNYKFNSSKRNKFFLKIKKIDKTLQSYSVFYFLFNEFIERIFKALQQKNIINKPEIKLSKNDVYYALKNFELNTIKAIDISFENGVKEFYLISLFYNKNYNVDMNKELWELKYNLYNKIIVNLRNKYFPFVKIIDLETIYDPTKIEDLICDEYHQTLQGNVIQADFIYKNLLKESDFINE